MKIFCVFDLIVKINYKKEIVQKIVIVMILELG